MSDNSPFTLVRKPDPAESAPGTVETPRPKVVLPTRRKMIPQATEPADLRPQQPVDPVRDVIERVKKAATAEPLVQAPRPAKAERKKLASPITAEVISAETITPVERRPGLTQLPPPRKKLAASADPAELSTPEIDPFESNGKAVEPEGFGQFISSVEAPVALTPAAIRRAKVAAQAEPIAQAPRKTPVQHDFIETTAASMVTATEAAPVKKSKKNAEKAIPQPKGLPALNSLSEMQGWLEADGFAAKNHTPRSDAPIHEVPLKSDEPALVSSSRLKFCCPSCNHTISMTKKLAGQKTRCPQCASAIRAPHPKFHRKSYNYENNIESLLHPERFELPSLGRPKFMGIPIPEAHTAIIGSAALILISGGTWFMNFRESDIVKETHEQKAQAAQTVVSPIESTVVSADPFAAQKQAEDLVREYLTTEGWEGRAQFVRDMERVGPLMKDYFERGNSAVAQKVTTVKASPPAHYQGQDLKHRVSRVIAELADGTQTRFMVEYLPEGPKIEWESSVAYSPEDWDRILQQKPDPKAQPYLLRVAACVDRYYNHEFSDDGEYLSVYLQDPISGEPLGNGYISRHSEDGARLRRFLMGSNKNNPDQVMLEVRPVVGSAKERVVEITRFVKSGFRQPSHQSLASNP
jgi:hypothetical protein